MAVSASRFLTKRRGDFIEYTAGMLSDPELFSDAEAFAGSFRDVSACKISQKSFPKSALSWHQAGESSLNQKVAQRQGVTSFAARRRPGIRPRKIDRIAVGACLISKGVGLS